MTHSAWIVTIISIAISLFGLLIVLFQYFNRKRKPKKVIVFRSIFFGTIFLLPLYFIGTKLFVNPNDIRPFIQITTKTETQNSSVYIKYILKNNGSQPARDVRSASLLLSETIYEFPFEVNFKGVSTIVHPNQECFSPIFIKSNSINELKINPYLHVLVRYGDISNTEYYCKAIFYFKITFSKIEVISIWQDCN